MCALYALHVKIIQLIYCYTSDTVGFAALRHLVNNLHSSHELETRTNLTPHDSIPTYYTDPAEGQESSLISTTNGAFTSVHVWIRKAN